MEMYGLFGKLKKYMSEQTNMTWIGLRTKLQEVSEYHEIKSPNYNVLKLSTSINMQTASDFFMQMASFVVNIDCI